MTAQPVEDEHAAEETAPSMFLVDSADDEGALPELPWAPAQAYAAVEDIRWMADTGETLAGVAARLSELRGRKIGPKAVERFLHRYDATDVLRKLTRFGEDPAPVHSKGWRNRVNGRPASPEARQATGREWVQGGVDIVSLSAAPHPQAGSYLNGPWHPLARLARGGAVRGRRL